MNLLAHSFLSFDQKPILIGNYLGDFVKGKSYQNLPADIQKGVLLHRFIDELADNHLEAKKTKKYFLEDYGHYSAVLVDIYYDHILATQWHDFHTKDLSEFVDEVYTILSLSVGNLNSSAQYALGFMVQSNWLLNYQFKKGIKSTLKGISHRSKYAPYLQNSYGLFERHQKEITNQFRIFMPEMIKACRNFLELDRIS